MLSVTEFRLDEEHGVGQRFDYRAFNLDAFRFCHKFSVVRQALFNGSVMPSFDGSARRLWANGVADWRPVARPRPQLMP
jgi:hypothetical protein